MSTNRHPSLTDGRITRAEYLPWNCPWANAMSDEATRLCGELSEAASVECRQRADAYLMGGEL